MIAKKILVGLIPALLFGCASKSVPAEQLSQPEGTVRAAEEVGAAKVPEASLELKLAKEETEQAKALFKKGNKEAGQRMLMRAEADAELALALAREVPLQDQAQEARDYVKSIRAEEEKR